MDKICLDNLVNQAENIFLKKDQAVYSDFYQGHFFIPLTGLTIITEGIEGTAWYIT